MTVLQRAWPYLTFGVVLIGAAVVAADLPGTTRVRRKIEGVSC